MRRTKTPASSDAPVNHQTASQDQLIATITPQTPPVENELTSIPTPPPPEPITWTYEEIYNPVENTKNYLAQVRIADIGIVLRCSAVDRRAQIRINLPKRVLDEMDHVSWAFDNKATQTGRWPINLSGRSISVPADMGRAFARNLQAFNALHLDIFGAEERRQAYTVPLRKSSRAIDSLDQLCYF